MAQLQDRLDDTPLDEVLSVRNGEYEGPLLISHAMTLDGNGSTLWARQGPVVVIDCSGVVLKNLRIEVTEPHALAGPATNVALQCAAGAQVGLSQVTVRGQVTGLAEESGQWLYPSALQLGSLAPKRANQFVFRIDVPVACMLSTKVAGLVLSPQRLSPGRHAINLTIRDIPADTLVVGSIELSSAHLTRTISLAGNTLGDCPASPASEPILLWKPEEPPAAAPPVTSPTAVSGPPAAAASLPSPTPSFQGLVAPVPAVHTAPVGAPASAGSSPTNVRFVQLPQQLGSAFARASSAAPFAPASHSTQEQGVASQPTTQQPVTSQSATPQPVIPSRKNVSSTEPATLISRIFK